MDFQARSDRGWSVRSRGHLGPSICETNAVGREGGTDAAEYHAAHGELTAGPVLDVRPICMPVSIMA